MTEEIILTPTEQDAPPAEQDAHTAEQDESFAEPDLPPAEPDLPETAEDQAFPDSADDLPPGMTESGLRQYLYARHARQIASDMRLREHYSRLARRAEALRDSYPDFDLADEMRDPVFARLTAPGVDLDPADAYEVVHRHSLAEARRRADLQRAAQAVFSGSLRPSESALSGVYASVPVKTDPRSLSPDDRRDIRRRVERGERVTF